MLFVCSIWRSDLFSRKSAARASLQAAMFDRVLSVGLVASAMATVANLATTLVTVRVQAYGPAAVAAYGVSARVEG